MAYALVRAVSRLIATPAPISDTVWMPSVAGSGDAARTSAHATVAAAKLCEICGLVDEKSGLVVMQQGATEGQIQTMIDRLVRLGFDAHRWTCVGVRDLEPAEMEEGSPC